MKILILTSATGSGHNMRARALQAWIEKLHGENVEVLVHEVLESSHGLYYFGVHFYNWIQRNAPWMHHLYFNYLELASMHRTAERILGRDKFRAMVRQFRPNVVVSVHAHTNHGFFELARRSMPDNPPRCITYCGELFGGYGLSRHWINPDADLFIGAVPDICEAAIKLGMPTGKTRCGGFLLRPPFYAPTRSAADRDELLANFGLDPSKFTLLLSTGDAGANNHLAFLDALEKAKLNIQVIALCGNSRSTRYHMHRWRRRKPQHVHMVPTAYIDNMHQLMQSVSAVVARPGTGATSEAIQCGCPIIHNALGGIMPQEWITVKYCLKNNLSRVTGSARHLAEIVREWRQHPFLLEEIRRDLKRARPDATPENILAWITEGKK